MKANGAKGVVTGKPDDNPRIPGLETGTPDAPVSPEDTENPETGVEEEATDLEDRGTMDDEDVDRMRAPKG